MEIRQLRYFTAIVEEGTVIGAARRLNMTQPPLTAQLHSLEEELGCLLFRHEGRRLHLTEAGHTFYQRASTILGMCNATAAEMDNFRAGTPERCASAWFPPCKALYLWNGSPAFLQSIRRYDMNYTMPIPISYWNSCVWNSLISLLCAHHFLPQRQKFFPCAKNPCWPQVWLPTSRISVILKLYHWQISPENR